jgi:hypothetical protein
MAISDTQFARLQPYAPRIETCWAVVGPSRRPLVCGIYRTDVGLEIRVGYSERARLYSCRAPELGGARQTAAQLRDVMNANGVFEEFVAV